MPRLAVLAVLVYTVWPMDLLPDWLLPVVGWADDLTLLWLALRWLFRSDPQAAPASEGRLPPSAPPPTPGGPSRS